MGNVSSAAPADIGPAQAHPAENLTVRTWTADEDDPVDERLPAAEAEARFAETRDNPDLWPSTFGAELVGDDEDILDRW
jgi:hypothetical protein